MIISKLPLRILREYFIVTLACEDEKQFEAHEIVIASSSPLFQTILKKINILTHSFT